MSHPRFGDARQLADAGLPLMNRYGGSRAENPYGPEASGKYSARMWTSESSSERSVTT